MPKAEAPKELVSLAKKLGVEIDTNWHDGNLVDRVRFKFPKKVWADLANAEGELLGACCANISTIRDTFINAMRDDGWMRCKEMATLVANMAGHNFDEKHPATKVEKVLTALTPHIRLKECHMTHDLNELEDVCEMVDRMIRSSKLSDLAQCFTDDRLFKGKEVHARDKAYTNKTLFEFLPVMRTISKKITEMGFPPVEGYGIFSTINGQLIEMYHALSVYETLEEAEKVFKLRVDLGSAKADEMEICAVRVSWENGLEKLDRVESKVVEKPNPTISAQDKDVVWSGLLDLRRKVEDNARVDKILWNAQKELDALLVEDRIAEID